MWPKVWKYEYVTAIPKKKVPESADDLRNISCTALVSKVMESYLLEWLKEEVTIKRNQYGGVKGSSVEHLLCGIWHEVGTNLEDHRAATVLTAIDYAKAFNRLDYGACLDSLAAKGASSQVIGLVATFLTNRSMQLRVGGEWSEPRPVTGGVPQGSLIGVFLFNVATDDLESGSDVHDSANLEEEGAAPHEIESEGEDTPSSPETSSAPSHTSTPLATAGTREFGTPMARNIRIARAATQEGGTFTFVGSGRERNRAKARRLFSAARETGVPPEAPSKRST